MWLGCLATHASHPWCVPSPPPYAGGPRRSARAFVVLVLTLSLMCACVCACSCSLEKCALALCNLSTYRPARDELMKVDAIDALATISSTGSELARRICSVALCNLVNDVEQSKRALSPSLPPFACPAASNVVVFSLSWFTSLPAV